VLALRNEIIENTYATVDALHQRFLARPSNASAPRVQEVNQDADSGDEADFDEEMGDAPTSAPSHPRERQERVVDDDGFELVQKPRRR
jgi:pre-rRNA-processing protein TSR2